MEIERSNVSIKILHSVRASIDFLTNLRQIDFDELEEKRRRNEVFYNFNIVMGMANYIICSLF